MITDDEKIRKELELAHRRMCKRIDEEREKSFKVDDKYKLQLQRVREKINKCKKPEIIRNIMGIGETMSYSKRENRKFCRDLDRLIKPLDLKVWRSDTSVEEKH